MTTIPAPSERPWLVLNRADWARVQREREFAGAVRALSTVIRIFVVDRWPVAPWVVQ